MSSSNGSKVRLSELARELHNISLEGQVTDETLESIQEQDNEVYTELKKNNAKLLQFKLAQDSYHKSAEEDVYDNGGNLVVSASIEKQKSLNETDTKLGAINQESLEENEFKNGKDQTNDKELNRKSGETSAMEKVQTSENNLKANKKMKFTLSVQSYEQDDIITVQDDIITVLEPEEELEAMDVNLEETQEQVKKELLGLATETMEKVEEGTSSQVMDVHEVPEWISNPEINLKKIDKNPKVQSHLSLISVHLQSVRNEQSSSSSSSKKSSKISRMLEDIGKKNVREELEKMYREEISKQSELVKENTQVQHHLCKLLRLILNFYILYWTQFVV